ncbi:MAG: hypothetical protein ABJB66_11755 [Gemmatimonadaceae bacterium]
MVRRSSDHSEPNALNRAFDDARFGPTRTLNLRPLQPTATQATRQVEQWLRLMQVQGAEEVLLITGRGNQSIDRYSPVREAVVRLLPSLRRRNVISHYLEHTPGSFVVMPASLSALIDAPRRRREARVPKDKTVPDSLNALEKETKRQLYDLAVLTLAGLGVHAPTAKVLREEMEHQFSQLAVGIPGGKDREAVLQQAIQRAAEEYEK